MINLKYEPIRRSNRLTAATLLFQQGPHHFRAEFVRNIRIGQQTRSKFGFFLLHLVDARLDGVLAEEFVDEDGFVLAAVGAVGGNVLAWQ
jgi:hypothetical protein